MANSRLLGILWAGLAIALCASPLHAGLIAHYTFDETTGTAAGDSSTDGTDHGGILKGTTFDAGSTTGVIGNALTLDGSSDYVQLQDGGAVQTGGTALQLTTFTLATWFKRTGAGATSALAVSANPLITKGRNQGDSPSSINTNYFLGVRPDGQLQGHFEDTTTSNNDHNLTGATAILNDVWYHAALTYDGTTMRLYLDGVEDASTAFAVAASSASEMRAAIGSALNTSGSTSGFFEGQIDDARIYDMALSGSEIAGLATAVPEPMSVVLMLTGMIGLVLVSRRRKK